MAVALETLLPFRSKRENARIRLVCFPFAGGAASVFRPWRELLPDDVDLCAVELPGRGSRFGEPPVGDAASLLHDLSALEKLPVLPTVYFGHSLGGRLAFALARRGFPTDALVVSGSRAAHIPQPNVRSTLSRAALVAELRRLGGTPRAVLEDADILDLMLPAVRADFRILETLSAGVDEKIQAPITALAAVDDAEVPFSEAEAWGTHAGGDYRCIRLDGGHFFLTTRQDRVLTEVRRVIDRVLAA